MFTLVGMLSAQGSLGDSCSFLLAFSAAALARILGSIGRLPGRLPCGG